MESTDEQCIVITGASSGIGQAMAEAVLERGYVVLAIARSFADSTLQHARLRRAEIDLSAIDSLPGRLSELLRSVDQPVRALVNNAGIGKMGFLEQLSVADIRQVIDTNFLSHAIVTKAFLPLLKRQQSCVDVLFMGSEAALHGARQGSAYCASKFALRGFAQALREECSRSEVRVSVINPGAVRTPFFDELHFEPGAAEANAIEPQDVAQMLLTILDTRAGTVIDEIKLSPQSPVWQRKS